MEAAQAKVSDGDARPAAVLKGSARGLDLLIDGKASFDEVETAITAKLAEAPAFFRGSDVRIRVDAGPLPAGSLARLDALTTKYELRIVELGANGKRKRALSDAVPLVPVQLAAGSAPAAAAAPQAVVQPEVAAAEAAALVDALTPPVLETAARTSAADMAPLLDALRSLEASAPALAVPDPLEELEPDEDLDEEAQYIKAVVGPIRSGVILEHRGHVVIFGDVNPGAEVRAEGNIIVLGRLRGIAHAGIGSDTGFILALRLEPQQLRIARMVARAADSDAGSREPELAHITNGGILVERYQGRLPGNLAASI
jgi:septum site-determining protein MinC